MRREFNPFSVSSELWFDLELSLRVYGSEKEDSTSPLNTKHQLDYELRSRAKELSTTLQESIDNYAKIGKRRQKINFTDEVDSYILFQALARHAEIILDELSNFKNPQFGPRLFRLRMLIYEFYRHNCECYGLDDDESRMLLALESGIWMLLQEGEKQMMEIGRPIWTQKYSPAVIISMMAILRKIENQDRLHWHQNIQGCRKII